MEVFRLSVISTEVTSNLTVEICLTTVVLTEVVSYHPNNQIEGADKLSTFDLRLREGNYCSDLNFAIEDGSYGPAEKD